MKENLAGGDPATEPLLHNSRLDGGVQKFGDLITGFEDCYFLGRHRDRLTGARIARLAGCLVFHFESSETANLDPLASLQGGGDGGKHGADDLFAILLVELGGVRDLVYEMSFSHLPQVSRKLMA